MRDLDTNQQLQYQRLDDDVRQYLINNYVSTVLLSLTRLISNSILFHYCKDLPTLFVLIIKLDRHDNEVACNICNGPLRPTSKHLFHNTKLRHLYPFFGIRYSGFFSSVIRLEWVLLVVALMSVVVVSIDEWWRGWTAS